MPQLSLYIDETTLKQIEYAAKLEKLSLSKYVVRTLNESVRSKWPEGFSELYGSIRDESYRIEAPPSFVADAPRESL